MRPILCLNLALLACLHLFAGEKVTINPEPGWLYSIKPDLAKVPPARTISNGFYFPLLDEQTNLLNGTQHIHYIKQIVNESGIQNASEVSVTFAPSYQQVVFHTITILREGVVINQLKAGAIKVVQEETDASDFQYNGLKRAFVTLKDVRKNDRIEVSFSLIGLNPVFDNKWSDDVYFSNETAICNYYKTIVTTPSRKLFMTFLNGAPKPEEIQTGGRLVYHWSNPEMGSWRSLSGAPSWYNPYPCVTMTEYAAWQDVVDWGLRTFNNYHFPLPDNLRARIAAWKKTANGDKDLFANLATHFVQDEVRYLGLEIGENTHQPHAPAEVYNQRFGDCKDKALLLASILQSEDIPAYAALISTTTRGKLTSEPPSSGAFDHVIVAIERSAGEFLFIDPTISQQRGELINRYIPAYGYSLILKAGENALRPVEPALLYNYDIVESLVVKDYDSSRFTVSTTYSGGAADNVRNNMAEMSVKDVEESYLKYYTGIFDGIQLAGPILYTDDSLKNEYKVAECYTIPQIWSTNEQGKRSFSFSAKTLNEYIPSASSAMGNMPLALSYPRTVLYTVQMDMPEDWSFDISDLHIKNGSYQFDFTSSASSNHISLHYFFKTFRDHVPMPEVAAYKADHKNIEDKIYFELYKNKSGLSDKPAPARDRSVAPTGNTYWPAVWFTILFGGIFAWLFRRLNARREEGLYLHESGYPLGGWTIVLGITIGLGLAAQLYYFIKNDFYNLQGWIGLLQTGGRQLQSFLFAQLAVSVIYLACSAAVAYWYLTRRDIFPRMFTIYVGILLSGHVFLYLFYKLIHVPATMGDDSKTMLVQFLRTCVYGAVWVTYIRRSERVKATFLQPFRSDIR